MTLLSAKNTLGHAIKATDGEVGQVVDFLFDDATSNVRYLVVDAGSWLSNRKVLLGPAAFGSVERVDRSIPTMLTRQQVRDSPPVDADKPVSRQEEEALFRHYGWAPYWSGVAVADVFAPLWKAKLDKAAEGRTDESATDDHGDPHLRSTGEVIGYHVGAADGDIGHVADLLITEDDWMVRCLVIDTSNWLPGKKVLVATDWLAAVDWRSKEIAIDLEREQIKASPEFDPDGRLDRSLLDRLDRHYGRYAA